MYTQLKCRNSTHLLQLCTSSGKVRRNNGSDRHDVAKFTNNQRECQFVVCTERVNTEWPADHNEADDSCRQRGRRTAIDKRLGGDHQRVVYRRWTDRRVGGRCRDSLCQTRQVRRPYAAPRDFVIEFNVVSPAWLKFCSAAARGDKLGNTEDGAVTRQRVSSSRRTENRYYRPHVGSLLFWCSLDVGTLSRPPSSSSLKVNNRSFRHASHCLWNQLPKELYLPVDHEDLSLLSDLMHVSSSFPSSPLSPSSTLSLFNSRLKTHLFHKSFPP